MNKDWISRNTLLEKLDLLLKRRFTGSVPEQANMPIHEFYSMIESCPSVYDEAPDLSRYGKWELTDSDNFQICRQLTEDMFELYRISVDSPSWKRGQDVFWVSHKIVYVPDIDVSEVLECYDYGSIEAFQKEYGEHWKRKLAQFDFELDAQNKSHYISPLLTWYNAKQLICRLSGYLDEDGAGVFGFKESPKKKYKVCGLQAPGEDGITSEGIRSLSEMIAGDSFDVVRVEGNSSLAVFLMDADVYMDWESRGIMETFKSFVREILDDIEKETNDWVYRFEDAEIFDETGNVVKHFEDVYLGY